MREEIILMLFIQILACRKTKLKTTIFEKKIIFLHKIKAIQNPDRLKNKIKEKKTTKQR